jgi:hypothetical protein
MFIATTFYGLLKGRRNSAKGIASGPRKSLPKLRSSQDNNQLLLSGAGFSSGKVAAVHSSGCWPEPVRCCVCGASRRRHKIQTGNAPSPGWPRIPPVTVTPKDKGESGVSSRDRSAARLTASRGRLDRLRGSQLSKARSGGILRFHPWVAHFGS